MSEKGDNKIDIYWLQENTVTYVFKSNNELEKGGAVALKMSDCINKDREPGKE
ncbi:MAG: hypothetical protein HUJ68_09560 [Clostridia bacterium]|nr:hypothetical protein [Clostridia bacterium]